MLSINQGTLFKVHNDKYNEQPNKRRKAAGALRHHNESVHIQSDKENCVGCQTGVCVIVD